MKSRIRQTTFKQFNWGGKRRGAGRKSQGERAGVSHAKRPEIDPRCPLHVTLKLVPGVTTMRSWDELDLLHRLVKDLNAGELVQVIEFSLQHNHVHLIIEAKGKEELSSAMNSFVSRLARGINKIKKRNGDLFAQRYHAVAVDTPAAVRNLLVYVLNNGRKHGTWLAASPDPFSSGDQFEGWADWKGAESKRWLPRPKTWLLSRGWKRHGLISIRESPKPYGPAPR
jgi:REP element-mobilizing transposase RayT